MKTGLFLLACVACVVCAAEGLGQRSEVYSGALSGGVLGAVGYEVARRIVGRQRAQPAGNEGRWDIWAMWGAGLLARLLLLGAFTVFFWFRDGAGFAATMISLAATYLVLLFWETAWLYRALTEAERKRAVEGDDGGNGTPADGCARGERRGRP